MAKHRIKGEDKKDNTVLLLLLVGGAALTGYALYTKSSAPGGAGVTSLPPGYSYNGYTNNTGGTVWVNLAGQIIDAFGKIVGLFKPTGGGGSSSSSSNPSPGPGNTSDNSGDYDWEDWFGSDSQYGFGAPRKVYAYGM